MSDENFSKITPRIFIGNSLVAKDKVFFKNNNIRAVLNCTTDIPDYFRNSPDIEYIRVPVEDSLKEKDYTLMTKYLPVAVEFIHKHADIQNNNILVHCWAGRQRSAVSVLAYLHIKKNKSLREAKAFMVKKRPEVFDYGGVINFDKSLFNFLVKLK